MFTHSQAESRAWKGAVSAILCRQAEGEILSNHLDPLQGTGKERTPACHMTTTPRPLWWNCGLSPQFHRLTFIEPSRECDVVLDSRGAEMDQSLTVTC